MSVQLTSNVEALRLFFTEDIYLVADPVSIDTAVPSSQTEVVSTDSPSLAPLSASANQIINFNYLGKNQKNILILVNDSNHEVSTDQGRELLRKLVKAIGLTAADFALVNYANYPNEKFEAFVRFFSCRLLLCFGVDPLHLGLPAVAFNQLISHQSGTHVFAKNLHDLDQDLESKKMLWNSFKNLNI